MTGIMRAAGRAVGFVLAAAMAVGGCGAASAAASVSAASTRSPAAQAACDSLEDCYEYEDMDLFLDVAWSLVQEFVRATYPAHVLYVTLRYVPHADTGREACTDRSGTPATYSDRSYEFCPADRTIYIGQDQLWAFYSEIGDAAAVVGLAHEYGHFLQSVQAVPPATSAAETIPRENQADCVAGAWFRHADATGIVEPDDLDDLAGILEVIASSEDDPDRDHGTIAERTASMHRGIDGGIDACNAFFPGTPLRSDADDARWAAAIALLRQVAGGITKRRRAGSV